jgi:hypothetical protein
MLVALLLCGSGAFTQIPVEVMAGHQKASIDLMFFKYVKQQDNTNSRWLFFSRARATVDYKMTSTTNLPSFGLTEAISYNPKNWKGFAPVAVVQVFNRGVFPKAGFQYAHTTERFTFFSWLVTETMNEPDIDNFLLCRARPRLTPKLDLFSQVELVNSFPTEGSSSFSFIQRIRLGLSRGHTQYGLALDLTQAGRNSWITTSNFGGFLRYVFQ